MINKFRNVCIALTATAASSAAFAEGEGGLDLTKVETAITAAESGGLQVGGWVIAAVAALVGIGVILTIIKKI